MCKVFRVGVTYCVCWFARRLLRMMCLQNVLEQFLLAYILNVVVKFPYDIYLSIVNSPTVLMLFDPEEPQDLEVP